jgi:hypothetical protein
VVFEGRRTILSVRVTSFNNTFARMSEGGSPGRCGSSCETSRERRGELMRRERA